jgi:hypothetical protein
MISMYMLNLSKDEVEITLQVLHLFPESGIFFDSNLTSLEHFHDLKTLITVLLCQAILLLPEEFFC